MQAQGSHIMPNFPQGMYYVPQQSPPGQNYPQGQFMMNNQAAMFNNAQPQTVVQNWPNGNGNWPMMPNQMPTHPVGNEAASSVSSVAKT